MSERARPRMAVLGTGAISQIVHIPILAEREDVTLAAVADSDRAKAASVAARFGVGEVREPDEVVEDEGIDAVLVCTPSHLHEEQALAAIQAGKHVFVERPMALDAQGAERLVAAARATGVRLVVGMPHRFRPEVAALRSFVAGGELGRLYAVRGSWLTRSTRVQRTSWRHVRASGGGALLDLGVSALDLCMWVVGYPEVARVSASMTPGDSDVEVAATVFAETVDGVALTLEVSSSYFAGEDRYYARVMGTEGSGSLPPLEIYRQLGGRPLDVTPRQPRPRGGENPYTNAYRRLLDAFVRTVSGKGEIGLPEEQIQLMRLVEAAYRSASAGCEVRP